MTLGRRIRQARTERGLSHEALGERIGVTAAELRGLEDGVEPSPRLLHLIAVATGRPVSFLVDGTEEAPDEGGRVRRALRGVLAWLMDDGRLADLAEREQALDERERGLDERERHLAADERRARRRGEESETPG